MGAGEHVHGWIDEWVNGWAGPARGSRLGITVGHSIASNSKERRRPCLPVTRYPLVSEPGTSLFVRSWCTGVLPISARPATRIKIYTCRPWFVVGWIPFSAGSATDWMIHRSAWQFTSSVRSGSPYTGNSVWTPESHQTLEFSEPVSESIDYQKFSEVKLGVIGGDLDGEYIYPTSNTAVPSHQHGVTIP